MAILVTGGAGYIGSHTCVELLNTGHEVVVLDNLSNSKIDAIERVSLITGKDITFIKGDVRDRAQLANIFSNYNISSVIHFAGLKAVGESCLLPLRYFDNNVSGSLTLAEEMNKAGVKQLVFSSSATVYGDPDTLPIHENMPLSATNPYGRSKLVVEDMLRDLSQSDLIGQSEVPWRIALLRYFNPVGAHSSGQIGEDPNDLPNNLMPYISQVAVGRLEELRVYGDDYDTIDGTGVRDYIHVVDLARGHVQALQALSEGKIVGTEAINLGTGNGFSVLQMVEAFERNSGSSIPYSIVERRAGDVASCFADANKAKSLLDWEAEFTLDDMTRDAWHWQSKNPKGY